jgi:serine/threonine-protein kinase
MLTPDGVARIVEFGIAKLPAEMGTTGTGPVLGTVPYMSPEQLDVKTIDYRTDIWSWGVTAYEMLVGQRPFRGESELATADAILNQKPQPLTELRPGVPFEVDRIVLRAMCSCAISALGPTVTVSAAAHVARSCCSGSALQRAANLKP